MIFTIALLLLSLSNIGFCWTTEDMELFDLVENTPQNFYQLMGISEKASAIDIRKAYRKLSTLYHPDKNKDSNAEETFRTLAAVAEVLRNEERRKMYDLILKTGLPDWRAPIYYYRRVRNMGLLEMTIFLLCLSTFGQYLFAWTSYLEKKYEIEEVALSKVRRKAKHQRKGKNARVEEEAIVSECMSELEKPKCQDLFPIRLFYFIIHLIKSSPSYIASCRSYLKFRKEEVNEESEDEMPQAPRVKIRKAAVKSKIPDFTDIPSYDLIPNGVTVDSTSNGKVNNESVAKNQKWCFSSLTEHQMSEFKKALKKFPNGTLQRWEKVANYLGCSVNEVVSMVKLWKNQQFTNGVPASLQGVTGTEKENFGTELYEEKDSLNKENNNLLKERKLNQNNQIRSVDIHQNSIMTESDKIWKQEEQKSLEVALQKFPKDTPARWDKIASFVSTKTKEECVERFKLLAQQVKLKKGKGL